MNNHHVNPENESSNSVARRLLQILIASEAVSEFVDALFDLLFMAMHVYNGTPIEPLTVSWIVWLIVKYGAMYTLLLVVQPRD